jgi:hypothetical protein
LPSSSGARRSGWSVRRSMSRPASGRTGRVISAGGSTRTTSTCSRRGSCSTTRISSGCGRRASRR